MHPVFRVHELLLHIFTVFLGDGFNKHSLAILARTCKAFNAILVPLLWKDLPRVELLISLLPVRKDIGSNGIAVFVSRLYNNCGDITQSLTRNMYYSFPRGR
jgi:hypothetical protein